MAVLAVWVLDRAPLLDVAEWLPNPADRRPAGPPGSGPDPVRSLRSAFPPPCPRTAAHRERALSHLGPLGDPPFVPAAPLEHLEGRDGAIRLDVGSDDGVRAGDLVLFGAALVGVVHETAPITSVVWPSAHPRHRIAATLHAKVARRRERVPDFVLEGSGRFPGRLEVHVVTDPRELVEGFAVATSGDDGRRAGLWVGTIEERRDRTGRVVLGHLVRPAFEPGELLAFVVLPSGEPAPGRRTAFVGGGAGTREAYRARRAQDRLRHERRWSVVGASVRHDVDLSPGRRSGVLDRGARDGVRPGSAVLAGGRYAGRVTSVGIGRSRFRFASDAGMRTPMLALDEGGRPRGRVRLEGRGSLADERFDRVGDAAGATPLDALVTAPGDPTLPPGVPIAVHPPWSVSWGASWSVSAPARAAWVLVARDLR